MEKACKICNNELNNEVFIAREMLLGIRDRHQYLLCMDCGCLSLLKIPEDLKSYYPGEQYYSLKPGEQNEIGSLKGKIKRLRDSYELTGLGFAGSVISRVSPRPKLRVFRHMDWSYESHILDVGTGSGDFLFELSNLGFRNLTGIDPFLVKPSTKRGQAIIKRSMLPDLKGKWDLIFFNHSFEHMTNGKESLMEATRLLENDGTIILRLPTVDSYAWRKYQENWVQLDAPRHTFIHSRKSLKILCSQVGLKIDQLYYDSSSIQFWGSEQYTRDIPLSAANSYSNGRKSSPFSSKEIKAFEKKSIELNTKYDGDQLVAYLKII